MRVTHSALKPGRAALSPQKKPAFLVIVNKRSSKQGACCVPSFDAITIRGHGASCYVHGVVRMREMQSPTSLASEAEWVTTVVNSDGPCCPMPLTTTEA